MQWEAEGSSFPQSVYAVFTTSQHSMDRLLVSFLCWKIVSSRWALFPYLEHLQPLEAFQVMFRLEFLWFTACIPVLLMGLSIKEFGFSLSLSLSLSLIFKLVRLIHICIFCRRQVSSCKIKSHKLLVLCAILSSALTTKAVKEGATIEPLGGLVDPEVQGDTTCRQFLEFYSAQGNKILPSSTPVPDDPYPSPHICWHTSIHAHVS